MGRTGDPGGGGGQFAVLAAIIDGLAAVYILPTVIGIARQVEWLSLVICLTRSRSGGPRR